ncbi:MAG: SusC/RagA family TonB-linked outer membrane protein [Tannerella sp.]|nr:SusC/RagA family TonB-linked outer membrane protein [Tannerella sp.]
MDVYRTVSLGKGWKPVLDCLEKMFGGSGISYVFEDDYIVLTRYGKKQTSVNQQSGRMISGIVSDETGEPVIGANIIEKGTTNGIMTDVDGKFLLNVSEGAVIQISYIGYVTQEIKTGSQTTVTVRLKEDLQALDEVVVIGYGTARKRDLTGSIASIKAEKLEAEAPRDITDLMRGTAAGLNVGMSTSAKGDLTPSVRGITTLSAGSDPTIVVDGVIYYGALSDINTNDVESLDVLKDASSAAVYGSQAANGVIVITTKKGKGKDSGTPVITVNANVGFVQSANQMKILDGKGYIKYRQDYEVLNKGEEYLAMYPAMFTNPFELSGMGINPLDWYNYNQSNPVTSVTDEELTRAWLSRLEFYTPEIDNYLAGIETNWADPVLHNGLQQDYTIGISNRTEKVTYRWSIGYVDREGIIVGDEYKNLRSRLNIDSKITNFLTIGMNTNFSARDESSIPVSWGAMVKNSPYASNNMDDPDSPYRYYVAGDAMTVNPLYAREYIDKSMYYYSLNANLYAQIKLPFGIEYQVNYTPYLQWMNDFYHQFAESEIETKGGTSYRKHDIKYHWTADHILRWKKEFGNTHNIEVTLLANAEQRKTWSTTANTYEHSPSDVLGYHATGAGLNPTVSSGDTYWTGDALMGRLFYSCKNKYMLTASVRRDGYSAFGTNNKRATFPSVALGYVFTSEDFMRKTSGWLNYGKIRFSWGQNGNRDIGQYAALSNMTTNNVPYIDNSGLVYTGTYMYVNSMANRNLKWERTESCNLGLDFSLFNDMVSGSAEAYLGTTKDLLVRRSLPSITGFADVMANLGKLENKGMELTLNANIFNGSDFTWSASSTFSMNRRKIVSLYGDMEDILDENGHVIGQEEADDPTNGWFIGQDPDRIWAYKRDGVWQLGEEEQAKVYGCKPGDFKYIDQDENGVLNNNDKVFQGYKTPRARISLRNDFTICKDFNVSFTMYSYLGHYGAFNEAANYNSGMPYRYSYYDMPHWTKDNPVNDYARISSNNQGTNWVNKSFVRLDNVSVSYNVPKIFLRKIFVQQMRLTVTARNMAVWSPCWNFWDPENGSLSPRSFNCGINFTL